MKEFFHFLADEYHPQKLSNIRGRHLVAYGMKKDYLPAPLGAKAANIYPASPKEDHNHHL